jgi:hypothetical protein
MTESRTSSPSGSTFPSAVRPPPVVESGIGGRELAPESGTELRKTRCTHQQRFKTIHIAPDTLSRPSTSSMHKFRPPGAVSKSFAASLMHGR